MAACVAVMEQFWITRGGFVSRWSEHQDHDIVDRAFQNRHPEQTSGWVVWNRCSGCPDGVSAAKRPDRSRQRAGDCEQNPLQGGSNPGFVDPPTCRGQLGYSGQTTVIATLVLSASRRGIRECYKQIRIEA